MFALSKLYWLFFLSACHRLEKVICFKTSWRLGMCDERWVRLCSGEVVPCLNTLPSPTVSVWRQPPLSPNPPLSGPETKVPPGSKAQNGPKGFKKCHLKASIFFFNPILILDLYCYNPGADSYVCLSLSFLSVLLPIFFFQLS